MSNTNKTKRGGSKRTPRFLYSKNPVLRAR